MKSFNIMIRGVLLLLLIGGCCLGGGCPGPVTPVPTPAPSPSPSPNPEPPPSPSDASCSSVCAHFVDLGCRAGTNSCVDVCNNVQASGVVSWNLPCRLSSTSCERADACER